MTALTGTNPIEQILREVKRDEAIRSDNKDFPFFFTTNQSGIISEPVEPLDEQLATLVPNPLGEKSQPLFLDAIQEKRYNPSPAAIGVKEENKVDTSGGIQPPTKRNFVYLPYFQRAYPDPFNRYNLETDLSIDTENLPANFDEYDLFALQTKVWPTVYKWRRTYIPEYHMALHPMGDYLSWQMLLYIRENGQTVQLSDQQREELTQLVKKHSEDEYCLVLDSSMSVREDIPSSFIEAMFPYLYSVLIPFYQVRINNSQIYAIFDREADFEFSWTALTNTLSEAIIDLYDRQAFILSPVDDLPLIQKEDLKLYDYVDSCFSVYSYY